MDNSDMERRFRHLKHGTEERRRRHIKKQIISTMIYCLVTIVVVYLLTGVIFGIAVVDGDSMTPTLNDGDVVIYFRLCGKYEREDIVLVKTKNVRKDYIKRVCALPGEKASCGTDGRFYINDEVRNEVYIFEETYSKNGAGYTAELGERQYFVMGDHRTDSRDSRDYGAVNIGDIAGKALLIIRLY